MYRRNNYNYVIDSSFNPFSLQEMMTPYMIYKDAFEKQEAAYDELNKKAGDFRGLAESLPEGSKARAIYEGYANDLEAQANDFSTNGLSMNNRRGLVDLKRRYSGEIGRLEKANAAMEEERKLRRQLGAKDSSMLYATDNLSIDDFLDGANPNLYNISGTELYTRGAAAGKTASSRVYSAGDEGSTLNGYYRKWVERNGYSKESMDAFRANASAIPELQQAADAILAERGVLDNLSGANLERARQSVLNGIIDGAVYNEKVNPVRDPGVMSASERDASARGWANHNESVRQHNLQLQLRGFDKDGIYHPENDQELKKASAIAAIKESNKKGSGAAYDTRNKAVTMVGADSGSKYRHTSAEGMGRPLENLDNARALSSQEYSQLVDANGNIRNERLRSAIGNGQLSDYEIYIIPKGSTKVDGTGFWSDDELNEDVYIAIPRESKRSATNTGGAAAIESNNDIPE